MSKSNKEKQRGEQLPALERDNKEDLASSIAYVQSKLLSKYSEIGKRGKALPPLSNEDYYFQNPESRKESIRQMGFMMSHFIANKYLAENHKDLDLNFADFFSDLYVSRSSKSIDSGCLQNEAIFLLKEYELKSKSRIFSKIDVVSALSKHSKKNPEDDEEGHNFLKISCFDGNSLYYDPYLNYVAESAEEYLSHNAFSSHYNFPSKDYSVESVSNINYANISDLALVQILCRELDQVKLLDFSEVEPLDLGHLMSPHKAKAIGSSLEKSENLSQELVDIEFMKRVAKTAFDCSSADYSSEKIPDVIKKFNEFREIFVGRFMEGLDIGPATSIKPNTASVAKPNHRQQK